VDVKWKTITDSSDQITGSRWAARVGFRAVFVFGATKKKRFNTPTGSGQAPSTEARHRVHGKELGGKEGLAT